LGLAASHTNIECKYVTLDENTPRGRSARDLAVGSLEHDLAWLAMVGQKPPSWNRLSPTARDADLCRANGSSCPEGFPSAARAVPSTENRTFDVGDRSRGVELHGEALVGHGSELKFVGSFLGSAAVRSGHRELSLYELQPLDHDAAVGLIDARFPALGPKVRQRVLAEAQGNPLALLELSAATGGPVASAIYALINLCLDDYLAGDGTKRATGRRRAPAVETDGYNLLGSGLWIGKAMVAAGTRRLGHGTHTHRHDGAMGGSPQS
jgi:hypothetical protein